jgi:hypothetical protein
MLQVRQNPVAFGKEMRNLIRFNRLIKPRPNSSLMNKMPRLVLLTHVLLGFTVSQVPAQTPTPAPTTTPAPAPEATPTLTLGDKLTRVLPDRHVTFRLLAPEVTQATGK